MTDGLAKLCAHVGVQAQYRGFDGQTVTVSPETQGAVLCAMGLDADNDAAAKDLLAQLQAEDAMRPLPPEVIVEAGKPSTLSLKNAAEWQLEAEGSSDVLARGSGAQTITLPALPLGIHCLRLNSRDTESVTWVLARPARAIQLEDHIPSARIWGILAALYGLTDGDAAPIGSYDLLGDYAAAMAGYGADFLGINPVHAMGQVRPDHVISPYSPSHRGFLNTWHCGAECAVAGGSALIDYPAALSANADRLSERFATFTALPPDAAEHRGFQAFCAQGDAALHDFALFETLSGQLGADWRDWPDPYRNHDAQTLAAFAAEQAQEITHTKWTQWQAEQQLAQAQDKARVAGMRVGLYLDLAVGPRLGGAETWAKDTSLVTGATLGAPPDPLGPLGQSWGLAPQSPMKCRADGYAGFARLLRATMRHAGMIRIDHVLGLMRSFWIPEGGTEGTYVSYPFQALLAVVAIESLRNNTIVVGEDLGLVPEGLRDELGASGLYGLDVLQYMRTPTGGFVDTADTRKLAVCAFATHDTPTIAGFFNAEDARIRHEIDGLDDETLAETRADRVRARSTLETADPVAEIHNRLARANASMVAIQLDDIAGRTAQQNLPGTIDRHPNWRLKAPFTVDEIHASFACAQLAQEMRVQGRSNQTHKEMEDGLSDS